MLGAIIGGIGSLVGVWLGNQSQEKINEQKDESTMWANRQNAALARQTNRQQMSIHRQNMAAQKEYAKSGIRWRVHDANKAGIHPLFALGAQTTSFAPQSVGLDTPTMQPSHSVSGGGDWAGLAEAGQNLGRAITATNSAQGQMEAMQLSLAQAQVTGAHLDNDIKRTQLASAMVTSGIGSPGIPQTRPSVGDQFDGTSGDAIRVSDPYIELKTRRDVSDPGKKYQVPGSGPSVAYIKNAQGGYEPIMPPELAESFESDWIGSAGWQIRNRLLPNLVRTTPPNLGRKSGEVVRWNPQQQHWEIIKPYTGKRWFPE